MKICVYGAGAIGGFVAVKLAQTGHKVSVVARGEHLKAIREKGLTLKEGGTRYHARVQAAEDPQALGPQDYVVVSVKAPSLPGVIPKLGPLLGQETTVVTAMNGLPWWFFHGFGAHAGRRLKSTDPDGALAAALPMQRIVGCVMHIACSVPEPGLIVHNNQNRFLFGEPAGPITPRVAAIVEAAKAAGIGAEARDDIRRQFWIKLLGNMSMAPLSILTQTTVDRVAHEPALRKICKAMMEEATAVGAHFGLASDMDIDARIDLGGKLVGFRTSMLQDLDKGRPVELDALTGSVLELAEIAGMKAPTIELVFALAAERARVAGLYR
jgi:2-dehydropantoate 2-reductase